MTGHIFQSSGKEFISFDDFGNWYSHLGGSTYFSWLELLDTGKWPRVNIEDNQSFENYNRPVDNNFDDSIDAPIFSFDLTNNFTLNLKEVNMHQYLSIVSASHLMELNADAIINVFSNVGFGDSLKKQEFDSIIRSFIDGERLTRDQTSMLSLFFANLFNISKVNLEDESASVRILAASLIFFVSGSKSEKLLPTFSLFDINGKGVLSRESFNQYLVSKSFLFLKKIIF
jgi:hypothetical protein